MSTPIGFVIKAGEAIPEDVTGVDDSTGVAWERVSERPSWRAGSLHYDEKHLVERRAPLTVTAVREQPAEPQRACWKCGLTVGDVVDRGAGAYADGRLRFMHAYGNCPTADELPALGLTVTAAGEQPAAKPCCDLRGRNCEQGDECCYLCTEAHHFAPGHGGVTCSAPDLSVPPAAESESVDLLYLVRQYAAKSIAAERHPSSHAGEMASALFARIEAEVNRLRTERDGGQRAALTSEILVQVLTEERDEARSERDDYAARLKATDASWAQVAAERDDARVEVERLRRLLETQANNFADAYNKLAEATPAPDPLVLSLPSVPDGAVAVVGHPWSGVEIRAVRHPSIKDLWVREEDIDKAEAPCFSLPHFLADYGPLRVVMREPRTWPKVDDTDPRDMDVVRGASGQIWYRNGLLSTLWEADNGARVDSFPGLQALDGPLVEVFDEDGTRP